VPGAAANLFSMKLATNRGAEVVMSWGMCYIKDKGEVTVQAKEVGGLLVVMESKRSVGFLAKEPETAELWHRRLGHAGYESLAKLAGEKVAEGMKFRAEAFRSEKTTICKPCILGKQTRQPFEDGERERTEILELSIWTCVDRCRSHQRVGVAFLQALRMMQANCLWSCQ
jgi:hypothetical protein